MTFSDLPSRFPQVFAPWEFCPCGFMYIVNRGTALWAGRPRHEGSTWGEDVILDNPGLQVPAPSCHLPDSALAPA